MCQVQRRCPANDSHHTCRLSGGPLALRLLLLLSCSLITFILVVFATTPRSPAYGYRFLSQYSCSLDSLKYNPPQEKKNETGYQEASWRVVKWNCFISSQASSFSKKPLAQNWVLNLHSLPVRTQFTRLDLYFVWRLQTQWPRAPTFNPRIFAVLPGGFNLHKDSGACIVSQRPSGLNTEQSLFPATVPLSACIRF